MGGPGPIVQYIHVSRMTGWPNLVLVEALAKEWGVEPAGPGRTTWFEVTI